MCREILRLRPEIAVRTGKQEILGEEGIERGDVGGELRRANPGLTRDDLGIVGPDEGSLQGGEVDIVHRSE
jgi:hypothetical protein